MPDKEENPESLIRILYRIGIFGRKHPQDFLKHLNGYNTPSTSSLLESKQSVPTESRLSFSRFLTFFIPPLRMWNDDEPGTSNQLIIANRPALEAEAALANPTIAPLGENTLNPPVMPNRRYRNPPPGEEFVREPSPEITCKQCLMGFIDVFRACCTSNAVGDQYEMQARTPRHPEAPPRETTTLPPLRGPLPPLVARDLSPSARTQTSSIQPSSLNSSRDPLIVGPEDPELPIFAPQLYQSEDEPGPSNRDSHPSPGASEPLNQPASMNSPRGPAIPRSVTPRPEDSELPIFAPLINPTDEEPGPSNRPEPAVVRSPKIKRRFIFTPKRNRYMAEIPTITVPDQRLGANLSRFVGAGTLKNENSSRDAGISRPVTPKPKDPELPIFAPLINPTDEEPGPSNQPEPVNRAPKLRNTIVFIPKRNRYMPELSAITVPDQRLGVKTCPLGASKNEEAPPSKSKNAERRTVPKEDPVGSENSDDPGAPGPAPKPRRF